MIIVEKVIANLKDILSEQESLVIDPIEIEWYETHKKIHKKITASGVEMGIRLDDHTLCHGLKQGDIVYREGNRVVVVNIPACEILVIQVDNPYMIPKVCYEIGNKHMPLFRSEKENIFMTPYDKPLETLLEKLEVKTSHERGQLDLTKAISTSLGGHHH